ncbi:MAG: alpha/beta fold hydrolase [Isosphaeraceae bacterium]
MRLACLDEGTGRAVVLLHGFPLSRAMWREQISGIGRSYRVIAPDLRGHGDSPTPDGAYTMDEMADDVVESLDALAIAEPVVLGGLSMGGYVAFSIMARYPSRVRGLILMDTRASADTPEVAHDREVSARAVLDANSAKPVVEKMLPRLFAKATLAEHPERVEPLLVLMEQSPPRGIAGALRGMALRPDRRPMLGQISVPTLVLVGEDDVITPPAEVKALAGAIPNSRLVVIPQAGHLAPYENPDAANRAILEFLQSLDAGYTRKASS